MNGLVDPRELISTGDVLKLTGLSKQGFKLARNTGRAPEPVAVLASGPVWTRSQIEEWVADRAARRAP